MLKRGSIVVMDNHIVVMDNHKVASVQQPIEAVGATLLYLFTRPQSHLASIACRRIDDANKEPDIFVNIERRAAQIQRFNLSWTSYHKGARRNGPRLPCEQGWAFQCVGRKEPVLHVVPEEKYPGVMWRIRRQRDSLRHGQS
jgi:hypothetical protein